MYTSYDNSSSSLIYYPATSPYIFGYDSSLKLISFLNSYYSSTIFNFNLSSIQKVVGVALFGVTGIHCVICIILCMYLTVLKRRINHENKAIYDCKLIFDEDE